jgi:hypothetical protein
MTFILILYTVLPSWFVGPLGRLELGPDVPPVYTSGPARAFPTQPTADGRDRLVVIVDPAPPAHRGLNSRTLEP